MSILRVIQPSSPQNEWNTAQSQRQAIAILLLDLENIKLDPGEEKFLQTCCKYPLQIKIAFANWRAISSQQDAELNDRGYQMIHVPAGKNSADMKMTAVGASLFMAYPNVQEVLVCSSDTDLSHLCNTLQIHGMTAYRVRKQADTLTVSTPMTGQLAQYPLSLPSVNLNLEECLENIKVLIRLEQGNVHYPWVGLSSLSKKFQEIYGFTLRQIALFHTPGKRVRDLFLDRPEEFAIHQLSEKSTIYVCLFASINAPPVINSAHLASAQILPNQTSTTSSLDFHSRKGLEEALVTAMEVLTSSSALKCVKVTELLAQFHNQYGHPVKYFLEGFNINQKPVAFLKDCSAFKLTLTQKNWQVKLAK